ncbi:MAG: GNAT family N-acetyltransferase [Candidatus Dependentiae bacterium]|nr:GNAT family N-acetyltransferase [Candidatus Dependentiae bacterium]
MKLNIRVRSFSTLVMFLVIIGLIFLGFILSDYYVFYSPAPVATQEQSSIIAYDAVRDRQNIKDFFTTDRYWLLSSDDYNVDMMLDHKAPNDNPLYVGALNIKVLRENGQFVGFAAYYKKTPTEGMLLFLAVKKEFRGKGYGAKLAQYALDDLKKMGISKVTLVTRTNNLSAQAVYRKLGFAETSRDDGYVYFAKSVK